MFFRLSITKFSISFKISKSKQEWSEPKNIRVHLDFSNHKVITRTLSFENEKKNVSNIVHKLYFTLLLYFKHSQPLSTKSWLEKSSTKIFVEAFGSISWMNLLMNTLSAESWAYTNKGFIEEMHPKASTKNFCWRFFQSAFCS